MPPCSVQNIIKYFFFTFAIIEISFDFHNLVLFGLCHFRQPRGLRRGSEAARLQGLQFKSCEDHGCQSFVIVVYCQVEDPAMGRSHLQMIPTECEVSNRVWSRNLNNEEVLANQGCQAMKKRLKPAVLWVLAPYRVLQ